MRPIFAGYLFKISKRTIHGCSVARRALPTVLRSNLLLLDVEYQVLDLRYHSAITQQLTLFQHRLVRGALHYTR